MPYYAIRKVREEIVTEEMVEAAERMVRNSASWLDPQVKSYEWDLALVQQNERRRDDLTATRDRQQRELADGTLVLETTEGESR